MIEGFFVRKPTIARHSKAPLFRERDQFLESLLVYGANPRHIKATASRLLHVVRLMELSEPRMVSEPEIERAAREWSKDEEYHALRSAGAESAYTLSLAAKRFVRFHGLLAEPEPCRPAFSEVLVHFLDDLRDVKGRSPGTLQCYSKRLSRFLDWIARKHELLENTTLQDVDSFLDSQRADGSKPSTINNYCATLQVFFRHLNASGIFAQNYALGIRGSATGKPCHLPKGPTWRDVQRLLKEPQAPTRGEIRNRAILLLLSIYGLRASEVSNLLLDDFDWPNETFTVRRVSFADRRVVMITFLPPCIEVLISLSSVGGHNLSEQKSQIIRQHRLLPASRQLLTDSNGGSIERGSRVVIARRAGE
jgi:integrase/recombinase XerD